MKKRTLVFLCVFIFVMSLGASFAWYVWQGADIDVNVAFSSLDKYLEYRVVNIDDEGNEVAPNEEGATATKVEYNKKDIAKNLDVYGNIYLNINNVSNEKIFRESNVTWTLKAIKNGATTTVSTGNFVGENINNKIPMAINIILDEETEYIVKINQPANGAQLNLNVSGMSITTSIISESIAPDDFESGGGKTNELYIRSVKYDSGKITDLGLFSSIYSITGYKIVNSDVKPSATEDGWIGVTSTNSTTEEGYIANLNSVNYSINDINNICIKNSHSDVYCKIIGKYSEALSVPNASLCASRTYNGESQQLTYVTEGTGYTLSNYNAVNAGTYTVTATLINGYEWNDGTTEDKTFDCSIGKKAVIVTAASDSKDYDGTPLTNNNCSAEVLIDGHTVACAMTNDSIITNAGSVDNVINTTTIKSGTTTVTDNYDITTVKGKLTIEKAENTITVTTPQTWSTAFKTTSQTKTLTAATGAQGSVTYAIQSQKNSSLAVVSYFTLSGTTLTMAANTPVSGSTYTVVIRATAAGNSNYNSGYKDITVNVTVGKAAGSISYGSTSITKSYGDASFTNTLTNTGDGTVSYTSSKTDVATVNSSTGAVTIKGVGTTTITATVTDGDNYTYATKTVTYTLTVGKQKVNVPTNVSVSTAGIVTWTNSSNATGYQISIDNSNWTTATSGSSYLSTITAGTGSRTVYVRAVNSDTTNYDTPSSSASKTVSVYKLTIQSNNTTGGTVNTTSLNVISGATYTTSSNVLTIKGGSTTLGTSTATAKTGYSFDDWSPTSGTITSATTITANFTANTYILTITSGAGGSVKVEDTTKSTSATASSGGSATLSVTHGDTIKVTATPSTGYNLSTLKHGSTSMSSGGTFTASGAETIAGTWSLKTYTLTITSGAGGSVKVEDTTKSTSATASSGGSATLSVTHGDTIKVTATANTGYSLNTLKHGSTSMSSGGTFTASGAETIAGTWTGNTYTATFYYYNGSAVTSTTASCTISGGSTSCSKAIPSAVTGSTGPYSNAWVGLNENKSMSTSVTGASVTLSSNKTYYSVYRSSGKLYYPSSESACTNTTIYRNTYITGTASNSISSTYLSTSSTGTTNLSVSQVSGYSFYGLSTSANTTTQTYSSVANAATTTTTTFYSISNKSITGTFNYYNGSAATSTTASANKYNYCSGTTTATTSNSNYTAPTATSLTGYTQRGWSTGSGATASVITPSTANTTFYMSYSYTVTISYNANGGSGAPSASSATSYMNYQGTKSSVSITLSTTKPTTTACAIFNGWGTSSSATSASYSSGGTYSFTDSRTIYAVWGSAAYEYYNSGSSSRTGVATSLSNAVSSVGSGGTIKACNNNSTGAVTISKNLTLDSNGKTITQTGSITISSGYTVAVNGTGTFTTSSSQSFNNAGTLTITSSVITNTSSSEVINNTGTLNFKGGSISANATGIQIDAGTVNMSGGQITASGSDSDTAAGILLNAGNLSMTAGSSTGTHGLAYYGGTATISGGTLTGNYYEGIWGKNGNITITDGVISGVSHGIRVLAGTTMNINGGTISGPNAIYVLGDATINIGGGTMTGSSDAIYYEGAGTVTMTAGTVKSTAHRGVEIASAGKFVMSGGTVEGSTSETYAAVWTSNASANASITGGTLSGYHGIGGSAGNIDVSNANITASYCGIYGAGTANVTINSGNITSSGYGSIWRDGTLTIKGGTITSASGNTGIYFNKGTINMSGGKVTSPNSHGIYYKKTQTAYSGNGTINISGGTVSGGHAVNEEDSTAFKMTFNMSGGKIEATGYGLIVRSGSAATITGGTLTSSGTLQTVWYKGTVTFGSNNGTVSTSSPKIYNTGTSANAVHNAGSGTWNFYDGIIYGKNLYNNNPTAVATGYYVLTATDSTYGKKAYLSNADGWVTVGSNKYYYQNGAPVTGTQTISGSTYYFNSSGVMQTGWQQISNYWYYFNSSGVMQKGSTAANTASAFYLSRDSSSGWYSFTTDGKNIYVQTSAAQSYASSALNFYNSKFTSYTTTANVKYALYHSNTTCYEIVKTSVSNPTSTSALGVVLQTAASSATPVYTSNNYPSASSRQTKCYYYGTDAVYTGGDNNGKCP